VSPSDVAADNVVRIGQEESSRSTRPTSQTTCSVDFWSLVTSIGGGWSSSGCRCKSRKDVCAIELVAGLCLVVACDAIYRIMPIEMLMMMMMTQTTTLSGCNGQEGGGGRKACVAAV
jgi:hypothetical protein